MKFSDLNLVPDLQRGIDEAGFTDCTIVQERTFAHTFSGKDVLVQSQTGTGKTAAFLITIFQVFATTTDRRRKALIVVPTRELAVQVEDEAHLLGQHLGYSIGSVYGGVGYGKQEQLLQDGVDVLVGTPGRLLDFASSGKLRFGTFDTLVIDEADRMFDMGFFPDVKKILKQFPEPKERLTMLFSATLSTTVRNLSWEHMNEPAEIEVAPERITVEEITQEMYHVNSVDKLRLLLGLFKKLEPHNALIFTNTKHMAVELSERLTRNGYPSKYIMGDLPQRQRLQLIDGIKNGEIRFLVATDVAARGLHIDNLDLVVNYDIPEDCEVYVHRIGRTARAGKSGKAITLACDQYVYGLPAIETFIGMKLPVVWPTEDLFAEDKTAKMSFRRSRHGDDDRPFRPRTEGRRGGRPAGGPRPRATMPAGRGGPRREGGVRSPGLSGHRSSSTIDHRGEHADILAAQRDFAARNAETVANEGAPRPAKADRPPAPFAAQRDFAERNAERGDGAPRPAKSVRPPVPFAGQQDLAARSAGGNQGGSRPAKNGRSPAPFAAKRDFSARNAEGGPEESGLRQARNGHSPVPPKPQPPTGKRPGGDASLEERIAYYRAKYGENFAVAGDGTAKARPKNRGPKSPAKSKAAESEGRQKQPPRGPRAAAGETRKPAPFKEAHQRPPEPKPLPRASEPVTEEPSSLANRLKGLFKKR